MAEKVLTVCGIHMHTHCMFYIKIHICLRGQQQTLEIMLYALFDVCEALT